MTNSRRKRQVIIQIEVEKRLRACDKAQPKVRDTLHQVYLAALKTGIIIPKLASRAAFEELVYTPAPERRGFRSYSENPNEVGG